MAVLNTKTYRKMSWMRAWQRHNKRIALLLVLLCLIVSLFWFVLGEETFRPILSMPDTTTMQQLSVTTPTVWVSLIISLEYEMDLMPHTLRHYIEELQVPPSQLLVALHHQDGQEKTALFEQMEQHLKQKYGILHFYRWTDVYTSNGKWQTRGHLRDLVQVKPCDWIVNSDADELLSVPGGNLQNFLNMVSFQGYDVVFADFNDRVTADGTLPDITDDKHLHEQFPLSCKVTSSILPGAEAYKAIAFYGFHRENRGGHYLLTTTNQTYAARRDKKTTDHCGFPVRLLIDHYKWIRAVVPKLERRWALYKKLEMKHAGESGVFLKHIKKHKGKLGTGELQCKTKPPPVNYEDVYIKGERCGNPATKCEFGVKGST